ncbi:MAG: hypothetical protein LBQ91_03265, partial [Oscillospiraceae bacterium]|nr:hypothetical protein [Oscillospiraceae bacterium]
SNQKGATSFLLRKEAKSLYAGQQRCCNVVRTHPMTGAVVAANASAPPHTGAKPETALKTRVRL